MARGWLIGNALWLQVGWWACVLGARLPCLLWVAVAGLLVHLCLCPGLRSEGRVLLWVTLAGCLLDSVLGMFGVWRFEHWPLPFWLAVLWLVLASGLRHSLAWAGRPPWRGAVLGLLGGPLAYLAGARLAGIELPLGPLYTGLILAPIWALVLPLALRFAARC